jgi:hypothetical protein
MSELNFEYENDPGYFLSLSTQNNDEILISSDNEAVAFLSKDESLHLRDWLNAIYPLEQK